MPTKAIVLAATHTHYMSFIRNFNLQPKEYKFARSTEELNGHHWDTPVLMLEGLWYNKTYTVGFMQFINWRFNPIFISEEQLWATR